MEDDTKVDNMSFIWYGSYKDVKNVYPKVKTIRYPKSGRPNPTADLFVVDLNSPEKMVRVQPPNDISGEHYFTSLGWIDADRLLVIWVPRTQVNASISICSASNNWKCAENTLVKSEGWVDFNYNLVSTNEYYFLKLPNGNFDHLAKISLKDSTRTFLTNGNFEVTSIMAVANDQVYYMRTAENQPNVRHFASVSISGNGNETCYTCYLYEDCTYNNAILSPDVKYYAWGCMGPSVPSVRIFSLPENNIVMTWTTNEVLKKRLEGQVLPSVETMMVPIAGGKYEAIVKLMLPADFKKDRRYPILVEVYGGPATQNNNDAFGISWGSYVATVKKYIYATIDGRGSDCRGNKLLFEMFKRLGTVEIEDQVAVVRYLAHNKKYVDGSRAGIWGWSYGGYASAMALATGNDTFKCATSVAPVTNWYLYDSVYTERYMLRPQDNAAAYNSSILMNFAKNFKDKQYLLIHGTADDNVHLQQSMMLTEALGLQGVVFNSHLYPDQNHGIPKYTENLYATMQQFFDRCFQ